ncbi:MAG: hypothetical protein WCY98_11265 [Castellaniella sp.]
MKKIFQWGIMTGAIAGLVGCASVGTQDGVVSAKKRTGGFMGLATEADVKTQYDAAFKDVQQVVIGGFKVGFNESKELIDHRGGGLTGPSRTAVGQVKLEGVSDAVRQQITDAVYERFVALLQDNGYEVVPRSTFTSIPEYAKVKETEFPFVDDKSGLFSSYGVGTVYAPTAMGRHQPFFEGEQEPGMFTGFDLMGIVNASSNFARYSPARLMNVSFTIDFAAAADTRGFVKHALELGQALAVDSARLGITGGSTGVYAHRTGSITLGQPVASESEFATIEDATDEVSAGARLATSMVFGFLKGGLAGAAGSSQDQTREYIFHADEGKYAAATNEVLDKAMARMIETMVSLR